MLAWPLVYQSSDRVPLGSYAIIGIRAESI